MTPHQLWIFSTSFAASMTDLYIGPGFQRQARPNGARPNGNQVALHEATKRPGIPVADAMWEMVVNAVLLVQGSTVPAMEAGMGTATLETVSKNEHREWFNPQVPLAGPRQRSKKASDPSTNFIDFRLK